MQLTAPKEFLYVGYYIDVKGRYLLKVGTTNDLERRRQEHNRNYKKSPTFTMPEAGTFIYLWAKKLSKYNTLRYEDKTREAWKSANIGKFVRNDRFCLQIIPPAVQVTIRKTYEIPLLF